MPRLPTVDLRYAVVAQYSRTPRLLATIRRKGTDIYLLLPHDEVGTRLCDGTGWNPHVSYHASGQHHVKTHKKVVLKPDLRQPPGNAFIGSEPFFDLGLGSGEWVKRPEVLDLAGYAELFVIDASKLSSTDHYLLSFHVTANDAAPRHQPYQASSIAEHTFRTLTPWIHASLWLTHQPEAAQ